MDEVAEHSFRTKTGTCTITPEQIILTRKGARGTAAKWIVGGSIRRVLVIYGLFGGSAFAHGSWLISRGSVAPGVALIVVGLFLLWNVIASRNNSAAPVIDRSAIRTVEAHPPRPPMRRGYFAVLFDEDGKERQRLIMVAGSRDGGRKEFERAKAAFQAAGVLPTD